MKTMRLPLLLALSVTACVSLTPGGAKVKVYETDHPATDTSARLPQGCRLLATDGPLDQQAPERLVDDPYRVQRNATAGKGGNVLLLRSRVLKSLPKTECPPGDHSVDCQQTLGTWYRVNFESYACDEPALQALGAAEAETLPGKVAWWWPFESKTTRASAPAASPGPAPVAPAPPAQGAPKTASAGLTAAELKEKILELMRENVGSDVIVAFVKSRRVAAPLSAEEIIEWKKSGITEPVIEAAVSQATR